MSGSNKKAKRKVTSGGRKKDDDDDDADNEEGVQAKPKADAKPRGKPKVAQSNRPHSSEREKSTSLKSDSEKDPVVPADDAEEEDDDDGDKMAEKSDADSEADATKSGDMEVDVVAKEISVRGRPRLEKDKPGWWGFKPVDYEAWATALPTVRQRVLADGEGAYSRLRIDRGPDQEYILIQERSADGSDEVFETVLLTKNARSEIKFGPDGGLVISHRP